MRAGKLRQGILIGVLLLAAFWLVSRIAGLADKARIAISEAHDVEWQYRELEERRAVLEANLAALATERGRDAAIRTAFGVARPGEEVIVVVPPEAKAATSTPPWWQRMFRWFR